jgi:hypothetical protein
MTFLVSAFDLFFVFEGFLFPKIDGRPDGGWGAHRLKTRFYPAVDAAVEVFDGAAAERRYSERLGQRDSSADVAESSVALRYSEDAVVIDLAKVSAVSGHAGRQGGPPIIVTRKVSNAHDY